MPHLPADDPRSTSVVLGLALADNDPDAAWLAWQQLRAHDSSVAGVIEMTLEVGALCERSGAYARALECYLAADSARDIEILCDVIIPVDDLVAVVSEFDSNGYPPRISSSLSGSAEYNWIGWLRRAVGVRLVRDDRAIDALFWFDQEGRMPRSCTVWLTASKHWRRPQIKRLKPRPTTPLRPGGITTAVGCRGLAQPHQTGPRAFRMAW